MKIRLDERLVELGLVEDITTARAEIMSGRVFVDGIRSDKAGNLIKIEAKVDLKTKCPYVSRGGYKIAGALDEFGVSVEGLTCLDIGSSTGGFTDCMLQRGASKVYAVDVGVELAWKLRQDERVVVKERTNIRHCNYDTFGTHFDFICGDVSFISLKHVFPVAEEVLSEDGSCVFLIKPQFEAKREDVGHGGIVRDYNVHLEVIKRVLTFTSLIPTALTVSSIKGGEGNVEYLAKFSRNGSKIGDDEIERVVEYAKQKYAK